MGTVRVTLHFCCLAAIAAAIGWNACCATAGLLARRGEPRSLAAAMRWMPAEGAFAAQYADLMYASNPPLARQLLQTAVRANPYDAASWTQLGLLLESQGEVGAGESALLRAAGADKTFLPAWTLANFYFRRQASDRFWSWARQAAQMAPDDATPLLRLAWYESPNALDIESRLQLQRTATEAQLLRFVVARRNPLAVSQVAAHLLVQGRPEAIQPLLEACDWLLLAHHPELALPLWKAMVPRGWVPASDAAITNGDFSRQPLSRGFDWRLPPVEGVSSFLDTNPSALGFELTGSEPDSFTLLRQMIPVDQQNASILAVHFKSEGIPPGSGLRWVARDPFTGDVLARTASLFAPQPGSAKACFVPPPGTRFAEIALEYQRATGTVHPSGRLTLSAVRLTHAEACP